MRSPTHCPKLVPLLLAGLLAGAVLAAPAVNSKAIYWRFLSGQGTAVTFQQQTSTANTRVLELKDDSAATVFSVDREGDVASAGSLSGQQVLAADGTQTLAAAGALTVTAGKSLFPVAGMGGAVTGCTVPDGAVAGTRIVIAGTDNTNTVQFAVNGATNIAAATGQTTRTLGNADLLALVWNGSKWCETSFNNNL